MAAAPRPVRHIILVIFDTLRRDAVSCYGESPEWASISTPHLDAFARESVRFDRAYPEALPTLCARRTIYTGLRTYPFHNGDFRFSGDQLFLGHAQGIGAAHSRANKLGAFIGQAIAPRIESCHARVEIRWRRRERFQFGKLL